MTITYKEFNDYIDQLTAEYYAEDYEDFSDYCHECADGSEYVIYYGNAWELVNMIRMSDYSILEDAQFAMSDFDIKESSINSIMSLLAYECIYQQLSLAIQEKLGLNELITA
jgi:hypothetical protein